MITVNLKEEDRDILIKILNEYYSELRMEISNTENWELKENLKKEEVVLALVLNQLK